MPDSLSEGIPDLACYILNDRVRWLCVRGLTLHFWNILIQQIAEHSLCIIVDHLLVSPGNPPAQHTLTHTLTEHPLNPHRESHLCSTVRYFNLICYKSSGSHILCNMPTHT